MLISSRENQSPSLIYYKDTIRQVYQHPNFGTSIKNSYLQLKSILHQAKDQMNVKRDNRLCHGDRLSRWDYDVIKTIIGDIMDFKSGSPVVSLNKLDCQSCHTRCQSCYIRCNDHYQHFIQDPEHYYSKDPNHAPTNQFPIPPSFALLSLCASCSPFAVTFPS